MVKNQDPDPGSGIFLALDPGYRIEKFGTGIRDKHPGSATPKKRDCSVADPDPGSGAFLTPGSGIPDPEWVFSGSRIPDPKTIF